MKFWLQRPETGPLPQDSCSWGFIRFWFNAWSDRRVPVLVHVGSLNRRVHQKKSYNCPVLAQFFFLSVTQVSLPEGVSPLRNERISSAVDRRAVSTDIHPGLCYSAFRLVLLWCVLKELVRGFFLFHSTYSRESPRRIKAPARRCYPFYWVLTTMTVSRQVLFITEEQLQKWNWIDCWVEMG